MDRLQSMRVFAKVVEHGSFARAATVLGMSASVVTRHVADLEAQLGIRLLNRTTRKLSLTETGSQYYERVQKILQEIDETEALVSSASQAPAGLLRIYSQTIFGQRQLAPLLPAYHEQHPNVTLDVTLSDRTPDLVEEGFDVGIFTSLQKFDATMIARQLAVAEVLLCASPLYIQRHGAPSTPQDVSKHVCLNFSFELLRHNWPVQTPDEIAWIPVTSAMFSNDGELLRQCATAGMGLALRPSYAVGDDLTSGRLVRLLPEYKLGNTAIVMVHPSRRYLPAKVRSFVDYMKNMFPKPDIDPWLASPGIRSLSGSSGK
jgi:DNA-binding transcriptional LysR family regulator